MCSAMGIGWRAKFAVTDRTALHELMRDHPLGMLVTHLPNAETSNPSLQATHIPFIFDEPNKDSADGDTTVQQLGTLRGHIARENPHAKAMLRACAVPVPAKDVEDGAPPTLEQEVMILFNSPTETYVSPSFYTHSKPLDGKVVPTWFFSSVQVYGTLTIYTATNAPSTKAFLHKQVKDLTRHGEEYLMRFPAQQLWKVSDAPPPFTDMLMKRIVGLEIKITRIEGKGKWGQEVKAGDQMGCIRGFNAFGTDDGCEMARQVQESMRKDGKRVHVLEGEARRVKGKKVKGKFGWYFEAVDNGYSLDRFVGIIVQIWPWLLSLWPSF